VAGVYYRLPGQGEPIDKDFFTYTRHPAHWLSSCWGTSTTPTSAGKVAQRAAGNPGDSCSAWRTTSQAT